MNRRQFSATVLRLALASACAHAFAPRTSAQEARPAPKPDPSKVFQEAHRLNPDASPERWAFEFELDGFVYHVSANGNGRRTKKTKTRGFNLKLDRGESIARVFYTEVEGHVLLLLHTNLSGVGVGFVTRLEQPSMRGLWRQRIPASDVGDPLRDGHDLYVSGMGFVGRLDLRTGVYVWEHDDLEVARRDETPALHAFDAPELEGDAVLFRERAVYNPRRTLVLDRKSGKFIRVE